MAKKGKPLVGSGTPITSDNCGVELAAGCGPSYTPTRAISRGPTGATGAQGATGATGATGAQGPALTGPIISTPLTMATLRLLGRATIGAGPVEEITLGTNLTFTGTTLNAAGGGAVSSVAGRTGAVVLTKADVGLSSVDNTADSAKPVSTAQAAADAAVLASANSTTATHVGNTSNPHAVTAAQAGADATGTAAAAIAAHVALPDPHPLYALIASLEPVAISGDYADLYGSPILGTVAPLDFSADGALAANSDALVPTQKAVKTYADQLVAAADALVFKGVIVASANPNYPAADRGWTYRISVAGKIGGASGINVEVGDLLLCLTDGTASGNQATVGTNWSIAQTNVDGAVIGPASATDNRVAFFDGASGKLIKDSGFTLSGANTGDQTNITGNAATVTTNANLTGGVTSVGNAATVVTNANLTGEVTSIGNAATVPNATVIGKVLTGYVSGAGTVAATDTILQAINKLNGNDGAKAPLASPTFTGTVTLPAATVVNGVTLGTAGGTTNFLRADGTYAAPPGGTFTGGTLTGALNYASTVTIASAATTDIAGAASNAIIVSGTISITALGTATAGAERVVTFSGILTLTHNATSLILPGGASITTAAGDVAYFVSLASGNWRCTGYQKASGTAVVGGGGGITTGKAIAMAMVFGG